MSKIYEQHDAAFSRVSAYVIAKDGERVATVAFKFPADGAGRLYAYVHWLGLPMVRGFAGGYGYDKRSAAAASAARKVTGLPAIPEAAHRACLDFREALQRDDGNYWDRRLQDAGFTVWQAVG